MVEEASKEKAVNLALARFFEGFSCSEAVLMVLGESLGIESELIPRIATGFCGGVGSTYRHICGALAGAVMATGIAWGRERAEESREKALNLVKELLREFRLEFGHTECRELIRLDSEDERWSQSRHPWDLREEKCAHYVRFVVERWLELAGRRDVISR